MENTKERQTARNHMDQELYIFLKEFTKAHGKTVY